VNWSNVQNSIFTFCQHIALLSLNALLVRFTVSFLALSGAFASLADYLVEEIFI